jgi:hypothetical protein
LWAAGSIVKATVRTAPSAQATFQPERWLLPNALAAGRPRLNRAFLERIID